MLTVTEYTVLDDQKSLYYTVTRPILEFEVLIWDSNVEASVTSSTQQYEVGKQAGLHVSLPGTSLIILTL